RQAGGRLGPGGGPRFAGLVRAAGRRRPAAPGLRPQAEPPAPVPPFVGAGAGRPLAPRGAPPGAARSTAGPLRAGRRAPRAVVAGEPLEAHGARVEAAGRLPRSRLTRPGYF